MQLLVPAKAGDRLEQLFGDADDRVSSLAVIVGSTGAVASLLQGLSAALERGQHGRHRPPRRGGFPPNQGPLLRQAWPHP